MQLTTLFLRELQAAVPVTHATIFTDNAHHLNMALSRFSFRFQIRRHGNWNAIERIFREVTVCIFVFKSVSLQGTFSQCSNRPPPVGKCTFPGSYPLELTPCACRKSRPVLRRRAD